MDKKTGKPLLIDGKEVRAEKTFTAKEASGSVEVEFVIDASALAGKEVVVFEYLHYQGREIAVHTDIKDKAQTVTFAVAETKTPKTVSGTTATKTTSAPKTGDSTSLIGFLSLLGASAAAIAGMCLSKRRKVKSKIM